MSDPDGVIDRCAFVDLEVDAKGRIEAAGAVFRDRELRPDTRSEAECIAELSAFVADAEFVAGHNVLWHDLPLVAQLAPAAPLLQLRVIDTLLLSPLAFPRKPYHRLIKNYKLVRATPNDPVADARLSRDVLLDEVSALCAQEEDRRSICRWGLLGLAGPASRTPAAAPAAAVAEARMEYPRRTDSDPDDPTAGPRPWPDRAGHAAFLDLLGARALHADEALAAFAGRHAAHVCAAAVSSLRSTWPQGPAPIEIAFASQWLDEADTASIVPAWVRRVFPGVGRLVHALRAVDCRRSDCAWCAETHSATTQLTRWFGFPAFRPGPAAPDGSSLQQRIAEAGMAGRSHLAILPTGGGKSLCFQLPALARFVRTGALTVTISPLQALMKDQVDGIERATKSTAVAAINGSLTQPERNDVFERVRLGEIGLLYVAPEQLRSVSFQKLVEQREIGGWVFDEAHCLSKWGHDFRPDYLFAARFIRELAARQGVAPPPIACLTATARREVQEEIVAHFREQLGIGLEVFEGGVERDNLSFAVEEIARPLKADRITELVEDALSVDHSGAVIVYCRTRRGTDALQEHLKRRGIEAVAYHAGLDAAERRERQDAFVAMDSTTRVVCATNAFGMGVDKADVRLVVHEQMPATLENYLQEAGRAGRDRLPARCVLLWAESDPEDQFKMQAASRLEERQVRQVLRVLRKRRRGDRPLIVTPGELLRDEEVDTGIDADERSAGTRVATAIAWLERGEFLRRDENRVCVISARPILPTMTQASERIAAQGLAPLEAEIWREVYRALLESRPDRPLDADDLAGLPAFLCWQQATPATGGRRRRGSEDSADRKVLRVLSAMRKVGMVTDSMRMTAFVRDRVKDPSRQRAQTAARLEERAIAVMREHDPDADQGVSESGEGATWRVLSLRRLNEELRAGDVPSDTGTLRGILRTLSTDGRGRGQAGSLELRHRGGDAFQVRLRRTWERLSDESRLRLEVADRLLETILGRVPPGAAASSNQLVEFDFADLERAIESDLLLAPRVTDPQSTIFRALLHLHEHRVITLQNGLAVFRRAMTIHVPSNGAVRYGAKDYAPLWDHYGRQTEAVHVMARFARAGTTDMSTAQSLVSDYFALTNDEFVRRHFADETESLSRRTAHTSYAKIVESLGNVAQERIVRASGDTNRLVLAGPGSGKTRVIVHRCAYLLRVERVPARSIAVLCFNRSTAHDLRRRLRDLVGDDARGVIIATYHGFAARLCGRSFAHRSGSEPPSGGELEGLLDEASELLEGGRALLGMEAYESREQILSGFQHILVDEYQDIDERQYRLVRAIAGRRSDDDKDVPRPTLLAVGDEDQTIYAWRGASPVFIRRFQSDYAAETSSLLENYRSTRAVIAAANAVIAGCGSRLKREPIRIDRKRAAAPIGGEQGSRDPISQGRVQVIRIECAPGSDEAAQAVAVVDEVQRLREVWGESVRLAVLARANDTLARVRAVCEARGVAVRRTLEGGAMVRLAQIREIAAWLEAIATRRNDSDGLDGAALRALRDGIARALPPSPWWEVVDDLIAACEAEFGADRSVPSTVITEFVLEALAEERRERALGRGVELRTIHGAKGLEFDHVLLCDGSFGTDDESRRLYYVGMTRARAGLALFARNDGANPYLGALSGAGVLERRVRPEIPATGPMGYRFHLLPLKHLYVDFAAKHDATHPIHAALADLRPGTTLRMVPGRQRHRLVDADARVVAALSKAGSDDWGPRADHIVEFRVVAMIRRTREVVGAEFRAACRVDRWELPLVEAVEDGPR